MNYAERALKFNCKDDALLGVLTTPAAAVPSSGIAVLVIVGGPQYRVGAHRQFIDFSRSLATAGHSVLRFDARGMGDSTGAQRSFEALTDDIGSAVDELLAQEPDCKRLALMGLCDGASAALMYVHDTSDQRVNALCLLNPWLRSDATLARTHIRHYYLRRLATADFWRKALGGGVGLGALRDFLRNLVSGLGTRSRTTSDRMGGRAGLDFRDAMLKGGQQFSGPVLVGLSSDDLTAREFADATAACPSWREALGRSYVERVLLQPADHTLSDHQARSAFEARVVAWLSRLSAQHAPQK